MSHTGTDIDHAVAVLKSGGLVAIPTETVYGLAAVIRDDKAVARIFEAKKRPAFDPLIVHIGEFDWVEELCRDIPEAARIFMHKVWPGPVTLLLKKSERVNDLVTSGQPSVAVRMPGHPMSLELLRRLGEPVAAPSANPFGYVSPTSAEHVMDQLRNEVDYVLDGGEAGVGLESTIVSFLEEQPVVLRLGGMSLEALTALMGTEPVLRIATHSNPEAPGQLDKHYATRVPLVLTPNVEEEANLYPGMKLGLLSLNREYPGTDWHTVEVLSKKSDLNEAARNLFAAMRRLDQSGVQLIVAERFPEEGLGRAINDRLQRASVKSAK